MDMEKPHTARVIRTPTEEDTAEEHLDIRFGMSPPFCCVTMLMVRPPGQTLWVNRMHCGGRDALIAGNFSQHLHRHQECVACLLGPQ